MAFFIGYKGKEPGQQSKIAYCLAYKSFEVFGAALEKIAVVSSRYAMIHGHVATYDMTKLPQPKERPRRAGGNDLDQGQS
jgi:hypothetical protein